MAAMLIIQQAHAGPPCDDITMAINTCIGGEVGEVTPAQLACLRLAVADAERKMSAAYQRRLQNTTASGRPDLASGGPFAGRSCRKASAAEINHATDAPFDVVNTRARSLDHSFGCIWLVATPARHPWGRADWNQRRTSLPMPSNTRNPSGGAVGCL